MTNPAPSAFEAIRTKFGCRGRRRHAPALKDDRGAAILEFTGFLPTLILVALTCIQLGLVGYSFSQAGSAARAAARSASLGENHEQAGRQAMSDWLADDATFTRSGGDTARVQVTVEIPELVPFIDMGWQATRTVTMPMDD
ncbi:TadE/TadG family type IV pilus assembly protein [Streptomyces sp. NPDC050418]|uniref:TadE/TadG family type IV pilus assembly protein n=1 Tax=Streptomyces sp. NPDC050418 TaxID=3365612 RepID=UPI0037ABC633